MSTKKQHFVPQVYLQGFAQNYKENGKPVIWRYPLPGMERPKEAVPIDSVCISKNQYEVTDENGIIVRENHLEKVLGGFENLFKQYRSRLENRVNVSQIGCKDFLSEDERAFWMIYTLVQVFRMPSMISTIEEAVVNYYREDVSANESHNMARILALPFFSENIFADENGEIFLRHLEQVGGKAISIGISHEKAFFTSDHPAVVLTDEKDEGIGKIVFPLTHCLLLCIHSDNGLGGSQLFEAGEQYVDYINHITVEHAERELYVNHRLTRSEERFVKDALRCRTIIQVGEKLGQASRYRG